MKIKMLKELGRVFVFGAVYSAGVGVGLAASAPMIVKITKKYTKKYDENN